MSDLNNISIGGRVMSQPKTALDTEEGGKVVRFTIAHHRTVRDPNQPSGWGERTEKIKIVCFGYLADKAAKLGVGAYVTIQGRLHTYEYEPEGEASKAWFEIVANDLNPVIRGREAAQTTNTEEQGESDED